jgi:hypothetical protein
VDNFLSDTSPYEDSTDSDDDSVPDNNTPEIEPQIEEGDEVNDEILIPDEIIEEAQTETQPPTQRTLRPRSTVSLEDRLNLRQEIRNLEIPDLQLINLENNSILEPKNFKQAMSNEDSEHWESAVKTEYENINRRNVWTIIDSKDMKKGMRPLGTKWVLKVKNDGRYRARLVVQGFAQIPGVDFEESHAPVANDVTIRLLLALSLKNNWEVHQIDVETAFLYGELNETVYLKKPEGFNELSGKEMGKHQVLALNKALYGLVQAARMWINTLVDHLAKKMGFKRSRGDPCFLWKYVGEKFVGILIYVDDCAIFGDKEEIQKFQNELGRRFNIKKLGALSEYVGAKFTKVPNGYHVTQPRLIEGIEENFDIPEAYTATPAAPGEILLKGSELLHDGDATTYRSGVGKLLYLVKHSRPDIASAVRELSKFMSDPSKTHLKAMYRVMQYVVQTKNYGLNVSMNGTYEIMAFTDANWAADKDTRKSVSGHAIYFGGTLVSWKSKTQQCTTLSSTESEYVALASCVNDMEHICNILISFGIEVNLPMKVYVDNTGAISLSKNWSTGGRTKHIDLRYHYIRELVEQGIIEVLFVRSEENTSDIFTKNLRQFLFEKHQTKLGVVTHEDEKEGVRG